MASELPKSNQSGQSARGDEVPSGQIVFDESELFNTILGPDARQAGKRIGMPTRIGQYEVIKELGRGGMGVVYLAHQTSLHRQVALKVLNINLQSDPEDAARFESEAKLAASLRHPNIVQIFEVGEQDGFAFMAMEYVEGGSLHQFLAKNEIMSPTAAAALLEPLARAMHHAHQRGIIHRDLKPANILISDYGFPIADSKTGQIQEDVQSENRNPKSAIPKITDFGLAKNINQSMHLTATGVALGTPSYMSPEQAKDDRKYIGPVSDVYSLGAILYECLTGEPPFAGSTPVITMQQVVRGRPTPPSKHRPEVPKELERTCLKCLEKNPKSRYPSAEALADALRTFLDGATDKVSAPTARSSLPFWLGVLLAISLLGNVILFALWRLK
jgi:serine/threonine protein kinase